MTLRSFLRQMKLYNGRMAGQKLNGRQTERSDVGQVKILSESCKTGRDVRQVKHCQKVVKQEVTSDR
jgi:hypothetical protein